MKLDNKKTKKTSNTAPESYQVRPALLETLKKVKNENDAIRNRF